MKEYTEKLEPLAEEDVNILLRKRREYGDSWKKRGGANAYFMLCRKFDRLEQQVSRHHHDIFETAMQDRRPEGILDDIGDLRRYLLLVEAEIRFQLEHDDPETNS